MYETKDWTVTDLFYYVEPEEENCIFNQRAYKELTLNNFDEFIDNTNGKYYNNYPKNLKVLAHFIKIKYNEWLKISNSIENTKLYEDPEVPNTVKSCIYTIERAINAEFEAMKEGHVLYIRVTPTIIGNISFNLLYGKNRYGFSNRLFTFTALTEFTNSRNIQINGSTFEGIQTAKLSVEPFFYKDFIFSESFIEPGVVSAGPSCATVTPESFMINIRGSHIDPNCDVRATLRMEFVSENTDRNTLLNRFETLTNFVKLAYREETIKDIKVGLKFKLDNINIKFQKDTEDQSLDNNYFDKFYEILLTSTEEDFSKLRDIDSTFLSIEVYNYNNLYSRTIKKFPKVTDTFALFTQIPQE